MLALAWPASPAQAGGVATVCAEDYLLVALAGGGNLSYPDPSCPGLNADPLLGPLQDNGGPTLTLEPGPGSPARSAS